jgi:hypothetical protein
MASSARIPGVRTRYVTDLNRGPLAPRDGRKFVVLGGGISGLIAARELMLRGCSVTVIERESSIESANDVCVNHGFKRAVAGSRFSAGKIFRSIWRAIMPRKAVGPAVERFWESLHGSLMTPASLCDEIIDMGGRVHLCALLQCVMPTRYSTFRIVFRKPDQSTESVECHHVVSAIPSPNLFRLLQAIPVEFGSDTVDSNEFQEVKKYLSQWHNIHLIGSTAVSNRMDIDRVIEHVFSFLDSVFSAEEDKMEVASLPAD